MDDCIFCKIVSGDIPSQKVYENDDLYVFDDINPEAPVHCLIIPKKHYASLNDAVPDGILAEMLAAAPRVAEMKGIHDSGYRCVINTGDDANQTVHHFHLHILGGEFLGSHTR